MTCPDCGYMLSAFDKECARCKGLGKQAQQATPALPQPQAAPAQPSAPNAPTLAPASAIPGKALACPFCGNQATQKVTAICEGGTWTTNSRSHTTMIGSDGAGHLMMAGGPTQTSSLSQTGLANRLMPPPRPSAHPFNWGIGILMAALGLGGIIAMVNGVQTWDLGFLAGGAIAFGSAAGLLSVEARRAEREQNLARALLPIWERARVIWNRAFYCGRCDHAYDAQTRAYAPAGELNSLFPPMAVNPAHLPAPANHDRPLTAAVGAVALLLVLIALFAAHSTPGESAHSLPADASVSQAVPIPAAPPPQTLPPVTLPAPAVTMRTKAGGGDTSQFSASGHNVNLPPVTLQPAPAPQSGATN